MVLSNHIFYENIDHLSTMDQSAGNKRLLEFGERVVSLCDKRGYSIPDLANTMETDYSWLSKIIKGQVDLRLSTVYRIADALGVDAADLLKNIK